MAAKISIALKVFHTKRAEVYFNFSQAEMCNGLKSLEQNATEPTALAVPYAGAVGPITYILPGFQPHAKN